MRLIVILSLLLVGMVLFAEESAAAAEGQAGTPAQMEDAIKEAHRYFASDFFNKCWELMNKTERTPDEDLQMINLSHASCAHWQIVGTAENWVVGEWQLSRVYAQLNRAEPCLYHADTCMRLCKENNIGGLNLGFAYEALARAQHLLGNDEVAKEFIELGKKVAEDITEKNDHDYLLKELNTVLN